MNDTYMVPGKRGPQVYKPPEAHTDDIDVLLSAPVMLDYMGKPVAFYRIGDLARALNRRPVTIRKLQDSGVIPRPVFNLPTAALGGKVRLYSRAQIEAARNIAREEGILVDTTRAIKTTNFAARLAAVWTEKAHAGD
jgi:hypothetical protein